MPDFSQTRYTSIFPTPLLQHVWDDGAELNAMLRQSILAQESASRGVQKSNEGGWHSETGQLEFCGEAGRRLVGHMYDLAEEATRRVLAEHRVQTRPGHTTVHAWANVNRSGDFNKVHVHPASTWSGTYYVDTGDPLDRENGTPLHLTDPCLARTMSFLSRLIPTSMMIHPKPGLMILFPSYVPHMVLPHNGNGTRISIAFNLRNEPYP
jgi:uncharacterized protein (TIGR02466 family)